MEQARKTALPRKRTLAHKATTFHTKETLTTNTNEVSKKLHQEKKPILLRILFILLIGVFVGTTYLSLQKLGFLSSFQLPFMKHVATGYIANGNYTDRKLAVFAEVNPKEGFQSKIVLSSILQKLISYGVIDMTKIQNLYQGRAGIPKEEIQLLTKPSNTPLVINGNNANWIVNLLWAIGLSNKMDINKQSPVFGPDVNNFASTGGWTLGKEDSGGAYFNKYPLITLTPSQQKRVKVIADNTYRPCCNNSTFFQDCNHGSAGMALVELGVSQGLSDQDIYKTLLGFNAFWFPQNYNEIALYFNVIKNTDWYDVDPKLALSKDYSSIGGWLANVDTSVNKVKGLLPQQQGGGSCGA